MSRKSDKGLKGFICVICQKNTSFLSRGLQCIWRHFKFESHYRKDRRYRYDHEDVIYLEKLDAISLSELPAELRAEIEATPPVILASWADEVDALDGVPSSPNNGCLFELLRIAGSQGLFRGLWNQFRITLPMDSPEDAASWSKTETLVVLVQTLYPRVRLPHLILSWPGKFLFHPNIWCFNFKPHYLLNYSSPKNDLYSVRKKSIRAFKSVFKLLRRTGSSFCAKTLHASCLCLLFSMFQNNLRPL